MSQNKFTPGPWNFFWEIQPNGCPTVGHKGLMVGMVAHSAKDPDQKETALANAALISAAPDMLIALEKGITRLEACIEDARYMREGSMTYLLEVFKEAIAKARGDHEQA